MKSIALNILDIAQNSKRAGASEIAISITDSGKNDSVTITITDNGDGMTEEFLNKVTDPFVTTRTTRKIGLGLPLLKFHAELAGREMKIISGPGKGTKVNASFIRSHIDRQPLGDIAGVITILATGNPGVEIIYDHITDKGSYRFSTAETKEYLGTDTLNEPGLTDSIREMIGQNIRELSVFGSAS